MLFQVARFALLALVLPVALACQAAPPATPAAAATPAIDRDLLDVTVADLHRLYDAKTYTVTQVVQWHLDRIDRFNGVYGAVEQLFHMVPEPVAKVLATRRLTVSNGAADVLRVFFKRHPPASAAP